MIVRVLPLLLIPAAFLIAASWWMLRTRARATRCVGVLLIAALLFATPWLDVIQQAPVITRVLVTLTCCAVLPPKLLDAHLDAAAWRDRRFLDWLLYLANPFVLVYRAHVNDPTAPRIQAIKYIAAGALRIATGAAILFLAFNHNFSAASFWLEHTIKLLGAYLIAFDGQFVLATGVMLLFTTRSQEFSRNPIFARTPADFWRRYNRDAGRFLYQDVFIPCVGRRAVIPGVILVFALNAALHEYLAWAMTGKLVGNQLLFFLLQCLATLLTLAWRPRGLLGLVAMVSTFIFNIATTALFFASVDRLMDWYDTPNPFAWGAL